ncbi:MAG: hypothetical protein NTX74_09390 [Flavobacterium sp.]|nr:hypothetical protein [Flavobacterium sp.]
MKSTKILLLSLFSFTFSFAQTEADKVKIIAETNVTELNRIAPIYDSILLVRRLPPEPIA